MVRYVDLVNVIKALSVGEPIGTIPEYELEIADKTVTTLPSTTWSLLVRPRHSTTPDGAGRCSLAGLRARRFQAL